MAHIEPATTDTRRSTLMRLFHKAGGGVAGWEAVATWTLEQEAKSRETT